MTKVVEMNCETGVETVRDLTSEEQATYDQMVRLEKEREGNE